MSWILFAQAADSLSGGAGWVGAGLLGLVLGWLLWVYLPAKDKQLKEFIEAKDRTVADLLESKDASLKVKDEHIAAIAKWHSDAVKVVVNNCKEEARLERETNERQHKEEIEWLHRIHDSVREGVHATRNFAAVMVNRQRLADAVQSNLIPIWTKALDGTVMSWNHSCEKLMGWSQGELVGQSIYNKIVPPDLVKQEQEIMRRIGAGELPGEYRTARITKSGERIDLLVVTSPIRDQSGRVIGASTIAKEWSDSD